MFRILVLVGAFSLSSCGATTSSSSTTIDDTSDRKPVLVCKSDAEVEGWDGSPTEDFVRYSAYIKSETALEKAVVKGAYRSDMRDLTADPDPDNRYDRHRFQTLEDAWCWFNLLVPEGFSTKTTGFKAAIQYTCEDWWQFDYINMSCFIRR